MSSSTSPTELHTATVWPSSRSCLCLYACTGESFPPRGRFVSTHTSAPPGSSTSLSGIPRILSGINLRATPCASCASFTSLCSTSRSSVKPNHLLFPSLIRRPQTVRPPCTHTENKPTRQTAADFQSGNDERWNDVFYKVYFLLRVTTSSSYKQKFYKSIESLFHCYHRYLYPLKH